MNKTCALYHINEELKKLSGAVKLLLRYPLKYRVDKISRDTEFCEIEFVAMRKVERNLKFRS